MTLSERFANGNWEDEEGILWDGPIDFIQGHVLDFCLCGSPEENLAFILRGLEHINEGWPPDSEYADQIAWYRAWFIRGTEVFGNQLSRDFFFYWTSALGLTEHGGCIPGWLTPKGLDLINVLKELNRHDPKT